ncbi:MAG: class I SAM-dependent methyltransferase [Deltaproteobacteria bacterium]|nr:class I SAM-dependent methyltransferase [Deltaproteobacteria bacterium]
MDRVFESPEAALYESWLDTTWGRRYLEASNALVDRVLDYRPGWRVLDVGCGLGVHLEHLVERGLLAYGLEAGPVMAKLASRRLGSRAEVELGDAHDLPYEDNAFDAVIMVGTLELLDRRAQVLAEAARVAASRVCLVTVNSLGPYGWRLRLAGSKNPLKKGHSLALFSLLRLVREVLGPVPLTWAGASLWPRPLVGRWPFHSLVGVCAAVTPRLRALPLVAPPETGPLGRQALAGHGRVTTLERVK